MEARASLWLNGDTFKKWPHSHATKEQWHVINIYAKGMQSARSLISEKILLSNLAIIQREFFLNDIEHNATCFGLNIKLHVPE